MSSRLGTLLGVDLSCTYYYVIRFSNHKLNSKNIFKALKRFNINGYRVAEQVFLELIYIMVEFQKRWIFFAAI